MQNGIVDKFMTVGQTLETQDTNEVLANRHYRHGADFTIEPRFKRHDEYDLISDDRVTEKIPIVFEEEAIEQPPKKR